MWTKVSNYLSIGWDAFLEYLPLMVAFTIVAGAFYIVIKLLRRVFGSKGWALNTVEGLRGRIVARKRERERSRVEYTIARDAILDALLQLQMAEQIRPQVVNSICEQVMRIGPLDKRDPELVKKQIKKRLGMPDAKAEEVSAALEMFKNGNGKGNKLTRILSRRKTKVVATA